MSHLLALHNPVLGALMRALGAVLCATLLVGCSSVFLYPDRVAHLPGRALGTPAEDVWIPAVDGTALHARYLPTAAAPRATVLFLHGNAENLSSHTHAVSWLPAQGYAVLALDYRGYGQSPGRASVPAVHEDAASALAWLARRGAAQTGPLLVYGQSLGGAVAIRTVAQSEQRPRVAAVVADSTFASYRRIAREKLAALWLTWPLQAPLSWLIDDAYAPVDAVAQLSPVPLLLIHGERDAIVAPTHAQALLAAARAPKDLWTVEGGAHIDALRRESLRTRLLAYFNAATQARPPHP